MWVVYIGKGYDHDMPIDPLNPLRHGKKWLSLRLKTATWFNIESFYCMCVCSYRYSFSLVVHICIWGINARFFHCFKLEDWIGHAKRHLAIPKFEGKIPYSELTCKNDAIWHLDCMRYRSQDTCGELGVALAQEILLEGKIFCWFLWKWGRNLST